MVTRGTSDGANSRSRIHVAIIGAIQGIAVATITAVAQYAIVVTPLKNDIIALKSRGSSSGPTVVFDKNNLPQGNQISFNQIPLWSKELWMADDFKEDKAWDKKCRTWATTALSNRQFTPVKVASGVASRGERDGIHLGIHCLATKKMAIIYGVAPRTQEQNFNDFSDDLEKELREISDGDLY